MDFRRKPKHRALTVTEDRQVREVNLTVDMGSVVDHRSGRAWGLVPGAAVPKFHTRTPYLVVCARSAGPLNVKKGRWEPFDEEEICRIAEQSADQRLSELPRLAIQEKASSMLRLAIAGLALSIGVMSMVVALTSGVIRIPGL